MVEAGETWVPCYPAPARYEVSNLGRVRNSKTKKILTPAITKGGYARVGMSISPGHQRSYRVHRLVLFSFRPHISDELQVHHINHQTLDNRLENLRAVSASENTRSAKIEKLLTGRAALSLAAIRRIRNANSQGVKIAEIAKREGISRRHVQLIVNGERWGYVQ